MSRRDPAVALGQMLGHAHEAMDIASGRTRTDLDDDRLFNLALTRLLEIIGEAANRVPADIRAANPSIPWAQLIALRNRLIHGYDTVDFDILWRIVEDDLPGLAAALEEMA